MALTVEQALQNIIVVVRGSKMSGDEHDALKESMELVAQRCDIANKLEKSEPKKPDKDE